MREIQGEKREIISEWIQSWEQYRKSNCDCHLSIMEVLSKGFYVENLEGLENIIKANFYQWLMDSKEYGKFEVELKVIWKDLLFKIEFENWTYLLDIVWVTWEDFKKVIDILEYMKKIENQLEYN